MTTTFEQVVHSLESSVFSSNVSKGEKVSHEDECEINKWLEGESILPGNFVFASTPTAPSPLVSPLNAPLQAFLSNNMHYSTPLPTNNFNFSFNSTPSLPQLTSLPHLPPPMPLAGNQISPSFFCHPSQLTALNTYGGLNTSQQIPQMGNMFTSQHPQNIPNNSFLSSPQGMNGLSMTSPVTSSPSSANTMYQQPQTQPQQQQQPQSQSQQHSPQIYHFFAQFQQLMNKNQEENDEKKRRQIRPFVRRARQTRPKVVEAKGAIQCKGRNRKKNAQCRNAALMEFMGPRPQYCAEHIELDPRSLYEKCKAGYQKEPGDNKGCKEVVLKEFGLCYKHYTDTIEEIIRKHEIEKAQKHFTRITELLVQLEKEAAAAKKKDGDLYQRKNKLIPKFQEMKKSIVKAIESIRSKDSSQLNPSILASLPSQHSLPLLTAQDLEVHAPYDVSLSSSEDGTDDDKSLEGDIPTLSDFDQTKNPLDL